MDDEVRDRAALYLKTFKNEPLAIAYVKEGEPEHVGTHLTSTSLHLYRVILLLSCFGGEACYIRE